MPRPGTFQKGHQLSVGNKGRTLPNMCSAALIQLLNELDASRNWPKCKTLALKLYDLAVGYEYKRKVRDADGAEREETVQVQPDVAAIREIMDRVQGKPHQAVDVTASLEVTEQQMSRERAREVLREQGVSLPPVLVIDNE